MTHIEHLRSLLTSEQFEELSALGPGQERVAVEREWLSEADFLKSTASHLKLEFIDLETVSIDPGYVRTFPSQEMFRSRLLPIGEKNQQVQVATSDPYDIESIEDFASFIGKDVRTVLACGRQIDEQLTRLLGVGGGTVHELISRSANELPEDEVDSSLEDESQSSSVVKLVNELLLEAITQRASDIHLEPEETGLEVRYRVDGLLRLQPVPEEIHRFRNAIVSRLKIMAKLNIAEKRLPQDGRINLNLSGRELDVRVSIIPMLHGEGIVMRLLDKSRADFNLSGLNFPAMVDQTWRSLIQRPHGMILVTGPTGSGKTTTLYSSLATIRNPSTKIITVEDPIEYQLKGISQIQIQSKIGLTFAAGLRSILRHDPDVILLGEIRDGETATSAIQAALTGHTVLSTLHTNDASSAYTRLIDMGVDPFLVSSTVEGVLAQRLLRKLCPTCKDAYLPTDEEIPEDFSIPPASLLYRPVGCKACFGVGYQGRIPIFELIQTDRTVRQLSSRVASAAEIRAYAISRGMQSLRQSGWNRVIDGITTIDEVVRCCVQEDEDTHIDANSGRTNVPIPSSVVSTS